MADGLQLLDIPQANIAEIDAGQFAYIVTPDGIPYRVDISDLVAAVNELNGCQCLKSAKLLIPAAEVQNLNSVSKPFGLTVPTGYYAKPISCEVFIDFNTTQYATSGNLGIGTIGGGDSSMETTANALYSTISARFQFQVTAAFANAVQFADGLDLEVTSPANPTAGDSDITLYLLYVLVEI